MIRSLSIQQLAGRIEGVDHLLMMLLAHRMRFSNSVGALKAVTKAPIYNEEREQKRLARVAKLANQAGLHPDFAKALLYGVIGESCKQQTRQLQEGSHEAPPNIKSEHAWYTYLRKNLRALTASVADSYEENYSAGFFSSSASRDYEDSRILKVVEEAPEGGIALDLGCGTGMVSRVLVHHEKFRKVVGLDFSEDMIRVAKKKRRKMVSERIREANGKRRKAEKRKLYRKLSFRVGDLEERLDFEDGSVSLVVMNLGTASDIKHFGKLLKEIERVLMDGGKFLLSFYNKDALVYKWHFLPWEVSLAAEVNHELACLDVHAKNKFFTIFAQAYTVEEVSTFFTGGLEWNEVETYPTVGPILPNLLFELNGVLSDPGRPNGAIIGLDEYLKDRNLGAYIVVTGTKKGS